MQIDFDARLAASTVIVDGREWCQGTLTNLATNPSFEAAGSTVEVWRNHAINPRLATDATGWGSATFTSARTAASGLPYPIAHQYAGSGSSTASGARIWTTISGLTVGSTYQVRAWVRRVGQAGLVQITTDTNAANFLVIQTARVNTDWELVEGSFTALAGTHYLQVRQSGAAAGSVEYAMAGVVVGAPFYFDAGYSPDPDLTASSLAGAHSSPSLLSGVGVSSVVSTVGRQAAAYQTGQAFTSGSKAIRFLLQTDSAAALPLAQSGAATSGQVYTVAAWVSSSSPMTLVPRVLGAVSEAVTLEPGVWTIIRTTVTAGAGGDNQTGLLLDGNSGHQVGDTVDVDDFTIVEGEHPDLMPFHGSTVNPEWPGVTYAWTGTPNASTSTRTTPAIDRIEVDRDPGTGWVPVRGGRRDVINGFVALTDHEMPLHQEVRYRVAGYSGSMYVGAFTGTVDTAIPGWCGVFVKIPANPNATVMVDPTNSIDIDSSTQGGSYDIAAGSSIAVAAWSGVNASRFTLNAITKTDGDSAQMRALLQKNRVILLQGPDWEPFPPGWYYVESVSEGLRGDGAIKQGRKWSLSLVSTGVPSGDTAGVAGATWNQIRAKYATWDELKTANETWFDVLQGGN